MHNMTENFSAGELPKKLYYLCTAKVHRNY